VRNNIPDTKKDKENNNRDKEHDDDLLTKQSNDNMRNVIELVWLKQQQEAMQSIQSGEKVKILEQVIIHFKQKVKQEDDEIFFLCRKCND